MYEREALTTIENINDTFKVLLITGPRQVGKTTLLLSVKPSSMEYVTLDDKVLREQAINDPKLFLEEHPAPLLIDEAQYAPNLFSYIKINVDKSDKNGMYWLTGSQQFHLMKNVSESLAGRVGIVNLNSFTYSEIVRNTNKLLFNPTNLVKADKIDINSLFERLDGVKEVIIATNPTREGETTALFLAKLLAKKGIETSRIANGLPIGSNIDYADELTLLKSLEGRKKI